MLLQGASSNLATIAYKMRIRSSSGREVQHYKRSKMVPTAAMSGARQAEKELPCIVQGVREGTMGN